MRFKNTKNKYNAKGVWIDGFYFHSQKEGRYYENLKLKVDAGIVNFFMRQVPMQLPGNTKYILDFLEFHTDGSVHFTDVKGKKTPGYIKNKKQVEALYPVVIEEK